MGPVQYNDYGWQDLPKIPLQCGTCWPASLEKSALVQPDEGMTALSKMGGGGGQLDLLLRPK